VVDRRADAAPVNAIARVAAILCPESFQLHDQLVPATPQAFYEMTLA
jgi:hypothetical protein